MGVKGKEGDRGGHEGERGGGKQMERGRQARGPQQKVRCPGLGLLDVATGPGSPEQQPRKICSLSEAPRGHAAPAPE